MQRAFLLGGAGAYPDRVTSSRGWLLAGAGLLLGVVGGWVVGLLRSPAVPDAVLVSVSVPVSVPDAVSDAVSDVGSAP